MSRKKIVIAGCGPAGMMAAWQAAKNDADVLILEKMDKPGLKLCITGKGRCNLTNIADIPETINHFNANGKFLRQAFSYFFNSDLIDYFQDRGLKVIMERGGRIFPESGKAKDVLDVMLNCIDKNQVMINTKSPVHDLIIENSELKGVLARGKKILCDGVILATGGKSYPKTGSSGDGFALAKKAGHTIMPLLPALVPLTVDGLDLNSLSDLNLRNVKVYLSVNGKQIKHKFGELGFIDTGITGPVVLKLSHEIVQYIEKQKTVSLSLDLKPALDDKKLENRLLRDIATRGKETCPVFLRGLLPAPLIPICLDAAGISHDQYVSSITGQQRKAIRKWLKNFVIKIKGYRPLDEALVTAGGIDTKEINPRTMESRIVKRLYFAGEIIDIHADTGGFNLQAAFSTGWLAGRSAAKN